MKIAVNTRLLFGDKLEGVALYMHEILRRMVLNNPNDEFYFLFDRAIDSSYIYADNVKGIAVSPPTRHPILWWLWFEFAIPRVLKKIKADVFLSMDANNSLKTSIPSVLVVHDLAYLYYGEYIPKLVNKYYRYFVPRYIDKANELICVSHATAKDVNSHYYTSLDKISVGYNGCRKEFHPHSNQEIKEIRDEYSDSKPYFLFVGAIHPRKNVIQMIESFDAFKEKTGLPHKLLIVGRKAWHNREMEYAYESSKYSKDVIFTGYLNLNELAKVTGAAFSLLYISLFEGFGVPLLEALNSNIPIVASNVSSIPEVVGDAAILVDPKNINQIVQAMETLCSDSAIYKELIVKGNVQKNKFSWNKTSSLIYDKCLSVTKNKTI